MLKNVVRKLNSIRYYTGITITILINLVSGEFDKYLSTFLSYFLRKLS